MTRASLRHFTWWLVALPACGPGASTETGTESPSSSSSEAAVTTEGDAVTTGDDSTTGNDSTSGHDDTTAGSTTEVGSTTESPPPIECPDLPPSLSLMWEQPLEVPGEPLFQLVRGIDRISDGRLVFAAGEEVAEGQFRTGVIVLSPTGEPLGEHFGAPEAAKSLWPSALAVDDADRPLILGSRRVGDVRDAWISTHAPDGAPQGRVLLESEHMRQPIALLAGDPAIVLAHDSVSSGLWVGAFDPATGARAWETELPMSALNSHRYLARGPAGEIVAAHGEWRHVNQELRIWRLDPGGAIVWDRSYTPDEPSEGALGGLTVTPDGQVVLLMNFYTAPARVDALSLDLADGAKRWKLALAEVDAAGDPLGSGALADATGLLVPIARAPGFLGDGEGEPLSVALHRVSPTGELLAVDPLDLPGLSAGRLELAPLRGACGELVLFHLDPASWWLGAVAP